MVMNRHETWAPDAPSQPIAVVDADLEQTVLGMLLLAEYGQATAYAIEQIAPLDFGTDTHRAIFEAMQALAQKGQAPTLSLMTPLVGQIAVPAGQTPTGYLTDLLRVSAPPAMAGGYIKALKEQAARRQLIDIAEFAAIAARNANLDVRQSASAMIGRLDEVCATLRSRKPSLMSLQDAVAAVLGTFGKPVEMLSTGLTDLDKILGGWHRQELTIVAARPSMGKSALLFSSMLRGARKGTASLIFSLEMPAAATVTRMLSDAVWNRDTPIPYANTMRGRLKGHEADRLRAVGEKISKLPIAIDDQAGLTVGEIRARAQRYIDQRDALGQRLDVLAIDHLGKIRPSGRYAGNLTAETGEISGALAEMAKDLDVAVVAAHQLNRAVEGRDNKRPTLADLRNTGDIEQDAETVMFLYRPAYYLERAREDKRSDESERLARIEECQHDLESIVAKNRNGPCCTIDLFVDMGSNVVRDRAVG